MRCRKEHYTEDGNCTLGTFSGRDGDFGDDDDLKCKCSGCDVTHSDKNCTIWRHELILYLNAKANIINSSP